jgi:hypothetical protein
MWADVPFRFLASAVIFWSGICPSILLPLAISPILSPARRWYAPWLAALPLVGFVLIPEDWRSADYMSVPAFASLFGVLCLLIADRRPARSKSSRVRCGIAAAIIFFVFGPLVLIAELSREPWPLDRLTLLVVLTMVRIWGNLLLGIGLSWAIAAIVISDWRKRWSALQ